MPGQPVTRAFRRFEDSLETRGAGRRPAETAAELLRRAAPEGGAIPSALDAFEQERYGARPPDRDEVRAAVRTLESLAAGAADPGP
jgi:hypothetical protein